MQLSELLPTEPMLGQHTPDSQCKDFLRLISHHLPQHGPLQPARITGVMVIRLAGDLIASELKAGSVDRDNVVTAVDVRRENWPVLAPENIGNLNRSAPEYGSLQVDHVPLSVFRFDFWHNSLHNVNPYRDTLNFKSLLIYAHANDCQVLNPK
jgi:hypothetical protein